MLPKCPGQLSIHVVTILPVQTHQLQRLVCYLCFKKDAATVAMVRHSLDVIKKLKDITNPGQSPIVTVDQPLFAIAKNVIMFGGLHIELAALKTLDDLKCSGWTSALVHARVATAGTADSFLTAAHITCTRHAYQVTACVLYQALEEAHQEYVLSTEPEMEDESLEDWCNQ